ncbi:MAG: methionine aminotransferase [Bacteroidia bacterium]|jgi:methionine aminotransferase|nr:methionine aminotransferase [Bacteroidota bacterium]MBK7570924.1 methionine aminotransferase [Bacteroidota bacterium]MBP9789916.1 methionine aminotransferase [Bacteroidia bacterium]MBP9922592.1 methionine aminotransferase [Bacteroidia bacterium]
MPHFPNHIKSKLPQVGTTIFSVMSALANEYKAINLSQGFPNFEVSEELVSLMNHYMKKGMNQYAPMQGIISLRERIAEKVQDLYGAVYNPETEINITSGGTQAIYTAITAMIREGDEVVIFEPAYDCYAPAIQLAGGIPVYIQLTAPDYSIDWTKVKKLITQKTKMIIINTPHNPAGTIMTAADMKELEKITSNSEITIISDEVYEHILFDGLRHESVMRYPKLAERSFVVFSFGKTYHTTGWKMGYCLAPENLMTEFRRVHQFVVFSSTTFAQYALADFMKNKNYLELPAFYQEKRDYFLKLISGSKFKFIPSKGSYFQSLDYSDITKEKDFDFAVRLTKENGIASVPVSAFYNKKNDYKMLRFCFAKTNETLEQAAEKLCSIKADKTIGKITTI